MINMPTETKQELHARIVALGAEAPGHWTTMQLKAMLSELRALQKAQGLDQLKNVMMVLNKAAKKKSTLQQLADDHHVPYTPNMTIAQIYGKLEEHLVSEIPPRPEDKVDFGKHGSLSYAELKEDHRDYAAWVVQTAKESDAHWRLRRLAGWLEDHKKISFPTPPKKGKIPMTMPKSYKTDMSMSSSSGGTTDSFEKVTSESEAEMARLRQEVEMLKDENATLTLQSERVKSRKEM